MRKYLIYKQNVVEGLRDLSNYDFQKVAWFENNQGLSSSFSDDVAAVFEDTALEEPLYKKTIFGKQADQALRELNTMVEAIGYDRDERELLDSPEMEAVRQKAREALELVVASDHKDSTVEIIE